MDQTAPSNQSLLWQHGKCREDANMDRDCDLRLDCNYEPVEPNDLSDYPVQQDLFQTLRH